MHQRGDSNTKLAVAELEGPSVHVYDVRSGSEEPMESFEVHRAPVVVMRYNAAHDTVISIDQKGVSPLKILARFVIFGTITPRPRHRMSSLHAAQLSAVPARPSEI